MLSFFPLLLNRLKNICVKIGLFQRSPCSVAAAHYPHHHLHRRDDISAIITVSGEQECKLCLVLSLVFYEAVSRGRERVPSSDLGGQVISISRSPSLPLTPLLLIWNILNVVYNLECSWPTAKARPSTSSTNLLSSSSSSSSSSYDLLSHFRSSFTEVLKLDRPYCHLGFLKP